MDLFDYSMIIIFALLSYWLSQQTSEPLIIEETVRGYYVIDPDDSDCQLYYLESRTREVDPISVFVRGLVVGLYAFAITLAVIGVLEFVFELEKQNYDRRCLP